MNFTNKAPIWNAEGQQPTKELQEQGFTAGYKPPAAYFNYMFNNYTKSINETQDKVVGLESQMQDSQLYPSKKVNGAAIAINDSANLPFVAMSVCGKSTQDGTPTPDAPIDIVNIAEDGNVEVGVYGKNISSMSNFQNMTSNGVANTYDADTHTITINADTTGNNFTGRYCRPCTQKLKVGVTYTLSFDIRGTAGKSVSCGWDTNRMAISLTGTFKRYKTTKVATRTDEVVSFYTFSTANGGLATNEYLQFANVQVEIGDTATEYEEYKEAQALTLSTPNGLLGIPVTSGGNYTDENGQQWICDEIDLARGVHVQRVGKYNTTNINSVYDYVTDNPNGNVYVFLIEASRYEILWTTRKHTKGVITAEMNKNDVITTQNSGTPKYMDMRIVLDPSITTKEAAKEYLHNENSDIYYILPTPIETALTPAEIAAYKAITANNPNTTVINDSGAGMSVEYVTQAYDGALGMLEDKIKDVEENITPIQAGTEDLTAGTTALASGTIYCVYE